MAYLCISYSLFTAVSKSLIYFLRAVKRKVASYIVRQSL